MKNVLLILVLPLVLTACSKEKSDAAEESAQLRIVYNLKAGAAPLQLNTTYSNTWGEDFIVSVFKFYTGHYRMVRSDGKELPAGEPPYYLSDASRAPSLEILATIPAGRYAALKWVVGVDSARNVSGVQSGALDPANGMFWTWNTGYIYAKMEGHSEVSSATGNVMEYHIGGFRWPNSAIVEMEVQQEEELVLDQGQTLTVTLDADILKWFDGAYPLRIADDPVCTTPGPLAKNIAGNYSGMFTVTNIRTD